MRTTSFNHVSVGARSLPESVRFYTDVFGMERIPSPVFRYPTAWLRLGDMQLHLVERNGPGPGAHHFAVNVDDFEAVYLKVMALGIEDRQTWSWHIHELPDRAIQLYLRDPADNLVEVDWPDVRTLDTSVVTDIRRLADDVPQDEGAAHATLFLAR
jgi:catechol 2,3-dioxygenase-like lactoylglutathione lyase family enzyme